MSFKTKLGEWFDFMAEHSEGLKTVAGLVIWGYGMYKGDISLITVGSALSGIGGREKYLKYKATGSIGKALDIPILRKAINKIPFHGTFTPNKKDTQ